MAVEYFPMVNVRGERGERGPVGPRGVVGPEGSQGLPGPEAVANDAAVAGVLSSLTSESRAALVSALAQEAFHTRLAPGFVQGEVPSSLGWATSVPLSPSLRVEDGRVTGSAGITAAGIFDSLSWARQDPSLTVYVSPTGSDSADGSSEATALRSIREAVRRVNLAAPQRGGRIYVDGAQRNAYRTGFGWYTGGQATRPQYDLAIIGFNGTPEIGPFTDLSGVTRDGTFSQTGSIAYSGSSIPVRAIDLCQVDAQGVHVDLAWRDTPSEVDAERGTWTLNAGSIYIRRQDDALASPDNTRVFVDIPNVFLQTENNVYLENLNLHGGRGTGVLTVANQTVPSSGFGVIVADRVEMSYGGGTSESGSTQSLATNGLGVVSYRGFTMLFDCRAHGNWSDGFNWHNAGAPFHYALTVNCEGYANGAGPGNEGTSTNAWTIHENVVGIDVAGRYSRSWGGTVHNIGTSTAYMLGTLSTDDEGDIERGGSIEPAQFRTQNSARIWCDRVQVAGARSAGFYTGDDSTIYLRGVPATPLSKVGNVLDY